MRQERSRWRLASRADRNRAARTDETAPDSLTRARQLDKRVSAPTFNVVLRCPLSRCDFMYQKTRPGSLERAGAGRPVDRAGSRLPRHYRHHAAFALPPGTSRSEPPRRIFRAFAKTL